MYQLEMLALVSLLILVHEAGHLAAANWVGIEVAAFSVGFGPILWHGKWRGIDFFLRLLPLGGFVQPAAPEGFASLPLGRRLAFFGGGPAANLLAAVPLLAVLVARDGTAAVERLLGPLEAPALQGVVGLVADGGRALAAGLGLEIVIVLSVSLALLNLLPLPVLDGGQMLLAVLEGTWPALRRLRPALTLASVGFLAVATVGLAIADTTRLLHG